MSTVNKYISLVLLTLYFPLKSSGLQCYRCLYAHAEDVTVREKIQRYYTERGFLINAACKPGNVPENTSDASLSMDCLSKYPNDHNRTLCISSTTYFNSGAVIHSRQCTTDKIYKTSIKPCVSSKFVLVPCRQELDEAFGETINSTDCTCTTDFCNIGLFSLKALEPLPKFTPLLNSACRETVLLKSVWLALQLAQWKIL